MVGLNSIDHKTDGFVNPSTISGRVGRWELGELGELLLLEIESQTGDIGLKRGYYEIEILKYVNFHLHIAIILNKRYH
jgi:hypothetical protein